MKKKTKKQDLLARPHLLPLVYYLLKKGKRFTLIEMALSVLF